MYFYFIFHSFFLNTMTLDRQYKVEIKFYNNIKKMVKE